MIASAVELVAVAVKAIIGTLGNNCLTRQQDYMMGKSLDFKSNKNKKRGGYLKDRPKLVFAPRYYAMRFIKSESRKEASLVQLLQSDPQFRPLLMEELFDGDVQELKRQLL